jgi:hypothetical protein
MLKPGYERVHTMTDYHDGPRRGIADYGGKPHLYESEWDDQADDYTATFRLSPAPPPVLALALESWDIWLRWEAAFQKGRATQDTHPALPAERPRCDELDSILKRDLVIDEQNFVRAAAEFKAIGDERNEAGWPLLQVKWTQV